MFDLRVSSYQNGLFEKTQSHRKSIRIGKRITGLYLRSLPYFLLGREEKVNGATQKGLDNFLSFGKAVLFGRDVKDFTRIYQRHKNRNLPSFSPLKKLLNSGSSGLIAKPGNNRPTIKDQTFFAHALSPACALPQGPWWKQSLPGSLSICASLLASLCFL